jgi:redox-sensing transcriptional repressor
MIESNLPKATLARMPMYLQYLKQLHLKGETFVSSVKIAKAMGIEAPIVKKDLSMAIVQSGRPKIGYDISSLIIDLKKYLRYDVTTKCVIVGIGGLGHALYNYPGFLDYGLQIVAGFDMDPNKTTTSLKPVYHLDELSTFIKTHHIEIGIITVPATAAQSVADLMVESGIKAIWNFAPIYLHLDPTIVCKNEDMAASLSMLNFNLDKNITKGKGE